MDGCEKVGIAAAHTLIAAGIGAGLGALAATLNTDLGVSCLVGGSYAAIIYGGSLAVHYAVGEIGRSCGIQEWKVAVLQACAIFVFNCAVATALVAMGVLASTSSVPAIFMLPLIPVICKMVQYAIKYRDGLRYSHQGTIPGSLFESPYFVERTLLVQLENVEEIRDATGKVLYRQRRQQ